MDKQKILSMLDSTLLKANASKEDILKLCGDAEKYRFAAVCVHPCHVNCAKEPLRGNCPWRRLSGSPWERILPKPRLTKRPMP